MGGTDEQQQQQRQRLYVPRGACVRAPRVEQPFEPRHRRGRRHQHVDAGRRERGDDVQGVPAFVVVVVARARMRANACVRARRAGAIEACVVLRACGLTSACAHQHLICRPGEKKSPHHASIGVVHETAAR
jgi:hypothetical protein